jgi:hypothetical protein
VFIQIQDAFTYARQERIDTHVGLCVQKVIWYQGIILHFFLFLQNYTVEVLYSPLFIAPLTETIFLTPAFRNMFPFTEAHIPQIREVQLSQHKVCE